jgi:O-antigen/teichoic acid export membrane protein
MSTLLIVFPSTLFSNALFAFNQQKKFMKFVAIGVFSNILLDILLIPKFGIEGSAVATLISQILTNIFVWQAMYKTNPFNFTAKLIKPFIASVVMGLIVYLLGTTGLSVLLLIPIGAVIYLGILYLAKEPIFSEVSAVISGRKEQD